MKSFRFRTLLNYSVPLGVFVGALAFYIYTGPPDIAWLDGAHYQRRIVLTEIGEGPWDQPLYVLLSQPFLLIPWGSLTQRANLASATFAAGACLFLYLLLKSLLEVAPQFIARRVGILTAISLGVSHTFWSRAVRPAPEVLDALLLAAILYCLVRFANEGRVRYFYASMLVLGLSFSNSLMMLFFLPFLTIWARVVKPPLVREIGVVRFKGLLLLAAGSAVALAVAAWGWSAAGFRVPDEQLSWLTFWRGQMMLSWEGGFGTSLIRFLAMLLYNFLPWSAMMGLLGIIELFQRQKYIFWLIFPLLLVHSGLAITLKLAEPVPAYLPTWVLLSIAIGYGWWKMLAESTWKGFVVALILSLSPLAIYHYAAPAIQRIGEEIRVRTLLSPPFEIPLDSLDYYLNPDQRHLPDARSFAQTMLTSLPDKARIASTSWDGEMLVAPARYIAEVDNARSELKFDTVGRDDDEALDQWARQSDTPLFLSSLHPLNPSVEKLIDKYDFLPTGYLYQVKLRGDEPDQVPTVADEPFPIAGIWSGYTRPHGYRLEFDILTAADNVHMGSAVLNRTSAQPLEGSFTRITYVGESFLGRIAFEDRIFIHLDARVVGERMEGTWQVFEAQGLAGTFVVSKEPVSPTSQ